MIPVEARCQGEPAQDGDGPAGPRLVSVAQQWAHDNLVPLNASIELTLTCNIRCVHCYNFDRDEPREHPRKVVRRRSLPLAPTACGAGAAPGARDGLNPELSTEEILRVLGELRDAGCLFVSFTGGEALAHPDLFTFLDRAAELNLAVQLLTNGTLVRAETAERLGGYRNLLGASVSLYGASATTHDAVTQVTGSFTRTWNGIERLRSAGVAVRLKHIILRQNAHETAAMMESASARGLPYTVDLTVTSRHDGTSGSLAARVDEPALEALCRGPLRTFLPTGARASRPEEFTCNCARANCAISARGDVYPCVSVPWSAGNVRERPFAQIWRDSPVFNRIRGLSLPDFGACAPCEHRQYCSHDRGAAFTATGDYTAADPFVCATAKLAHQLADEAASEPHR